jgi:hypothetical protein
MFKPGRAMRAPKSGSEGGFVMRLAGLALWAPVCALAGVTTTDSPEAAKPPATEKATTASGLYQIRCWQHGRLLFEENQIALPADNARYGVKMAGTDRKGQPIFVVETKNATCLIRRALDERAWPR